MQVIQQQLTFVFARTAWLTLRVEILKMFGQHFASFKQQKLSAIVEPEKQSVTFYLQNPNIHVHVKGNMCKIIRKGV